MTKVLGIDSSTQSTKALLLDVDSGEVVAQRRVAHPRCTEVDPVVWLKALDASTEGLLEQADAVAVGGQQHGMIALDGHDKVVRDALLWNDTRSASAAVDLIRELGGPAAAVRRTGSVHVASITSTKMRWMRDTEPNNAARTQRVVLPHDYVSHALCPDSEWFTDRGDASGTGYFSPVADGWDAELACMAIGHPIEMPTIAPSPNAVMGITPTGAAVAAGTGDNMAAALGLGMGAGDVMVSVGTSGVVAMVSPLATCDETGLVSGFADATGRWLPLSCTINAARILDFGAALLGVDHAALSHLALESVPGAHGVVFIPYLDGERTPNRPNATGVMRGITSTTSRPDIARACVEGLACSIVDALDALESASVIPVSRLLLIGGAARSEALRIILAGIFGGPIEVPIAGEYVALGAAAQAAWALSGASEPPQWLKDITNQEVVEATPDVLGAYRSLRDDTRDW